MNKTKQRRIEIILNVLAVMWRENLVHRNLIVKEAIKVADEIIERTK